MNFSFVFFFFKIISEKNGVFVTDCCREEGNESDLCGVEPEDSLFKGGSLLSDVVPWDEWVYVHFTHAYRHSECANSPLCVHL